MIDTRVQTFLRPSQLWLTMPYRFVDHAQAAEFLRNATKSNPDRQFRLFDPTTGREVAA